MTRREQHTWGRERVQPGSSEWPSTGFSTQIGDYDKARPAAAIKRTLKREIPLGHVVVSLIIFSVVGAIAVHVLAHLFRG